MTREEIIRDLSERSAGAGADQYMTLRCDVAREIVKLLRDVTNPRAAGHVRPAFTKRTRTAIAGSISGVKSAGCAPGMSTRGVRAMTEQETVMVRSKEDLMRGLKMCASASCDGCPYEDIGCSPPLAYDAMLVIEDLERQIRSYDKYCQTLEEQKGKCRDD